MLWLDAFCANVDRSWRNPNLLRWHGDLWVIDHGAALYFHHGWAGGVGDPERFAAPALGAADHVLRAQAGGSGDRRRAERPGRRPPSSTEVVAEVPDAWLEPVPGAEDAAALRAAYVEFLTARLGPRQWLPAGAA